MQQLLRRERTRRLRLTIWIDRTQQQQPRRRHPHRLPQLRNRPLKPSILKRPRCHHPQTEKIPSHSHGHQNQQRHPPLRHHIQPNRRNRRHHQKIQRHILKLLHQSPAHQPRPIKMIAKQLHTNPAQHTQRKQRKTPHQLTPAPWQLHRRSQ